MAMRGLIPQRRLRRSAAETLPGFAHHPGVRAIAVRPPVQFAMAAAFVLVAESAVLASRSFALHPGVFRFAVIFDVCVVIPGAWWLLVSRRWQSTARVALLCTVACALVFGREVRLLAAPLEIALVWWAFKSRGPVARAIASEARMFWYALFTWHQKPPVGFTTYKRAGWPAIYFALGVVVLGEGIPLHFVLPRGWAIASLVLHVYTLLWLLGDLRAMQLRPITVSRDTLHLRIGLKWEADIPLSEIESVELTQKAEGRKLAVLGSPNLVLRLRKPHDLHGLFGIQRTARTLSLQVDEPGALLRAISGST